MNIQEIIQSRRNIKKFKPDPVDLNKIRSWLQTAAMAPNHRLTQPWEIYFIGAETRAKLNHKRNFGNAPFVMAVLSRHGATAVETEENAIATACFIQNFNLIAWEEGVGTYWSSVGLTPKSREILGIPDDCDILGVFGIGYPEETPEPKERQPIAEKIKELP